MPNRKALYEALRRNQYIMPDIKENLVTSGWMLGVVQGNQWCLSSSEVSCLQQCVSPPPRKFLAKILIQTMSEINIPAEKVEPMKATAKLIAKHPPNVSWMLICLAQMKSDHEIFGKDYVAPKLDRGGIAISEASVDNIAHFFTGLPLKHN